MRYCIFTFILCFLPSVIQAQILFTEVMYDHEGADTDLEWVELYNDSDAIIDLSGWKFNDGSNHALNEPPTNGSQGSLEIGANAYIVLAGNANTFLSEFTGFTGTVIDTVMSLANTTDTISLLDETGATVASFTYDSAHGGTGDGTTLQKVNSTWGNGDPTPGKSNTHNTSDTTDTTTDTTDSATDEVSEEASLLDFVEPSFTAQILSDIVISAGVPSTFNTYVENNEGSVIHTGIYSWNMGDGTSYVQKGGREFTHTYNYPGEYVVLLDYFKIGSLTPEDTDRLVVKVTEPGVNILSFIQGTVELQNTTQYEKNMAGWLLTDGYTTYTFPLNSIILSGKKIKFSPKITKLSPNASSVKLLFPTGSIATVYPMPVTPIAKTKTTIASKSSEAIDLQNSVIATPESITSDLITASAIQAGSTLEQSQKNTTKAIPILGFLGILILGSGTIFYMKQAQKNNSNNTEADAFELIEE